MKDRKCKSTLRMFLNALFTIDELSDDDVHASFNPSVALEYQPSGPVFLIFDVTYRAMLSRTSYLKSRGQRA